MKSVRSVSFGTVCCCGCLTTLVCGIEMVLVTVFVSGFAIFLASATTLLLVPSINSSAGHFVSSSTRSISPRMAFKACWMSCKALLFTTVSVCVALAARLSNVAIAVHQHVNHC